MSNGIPGPLGPFRGKVGFIDKIHFIDQFDKLDENTIDMADTPKKRAAAKSEQAARGAREAIERESALLSFQAANQDSLNFRATQRSFLTVDPNASGIFNTTG